MVSKDTRNLPSREGSGSKKKKSGNNLGRTARANPSVLVERPNSTISELGDKSSHHEYSSSMFNIKKKIENDRRFDQEDYDIDDRDLPIDLIYARTIDQHSDLIDSWRSYNSDLDGLNQPKYCGVKSTACCCCCLTCCSANGRNRI